MTFYYCTFNKKREREEGERRERGGRVRRGDELRVLRSAASCVSACLRVKRVLM